MYDMIILDYNEAWVTGNWNCLDLCPCSKLMCMQGQLPSSTHVLLLILKWWMWFIKVQCRWLVKMLSGQTNQMSGILFPGRMSFPSYIQLSMTTNLIKSAKTYYVHCRKVVKKMSQTASATAKFSKDDTNRYKYLIFDKYIWLYLYSISLPPDQLQFNDRQLAKTLTNGSFYRISWKQQSDVADSHKITSLLR